MDGTAYAIVNSGQTTLTFVRSTQTGLTLNRAGQSITTVGGTTYSNVTILPNVETWSTTSGTATTPWNSYKSSITTISCASGCEIQPVSTYCWFQGMSALKNFTGTGFNLSSTTSAEKMFQSCGIATLNLTGMTTTGVQNMSYMFEGCDQMTSITIPATFTAAACTDMSYMFSGCSGLTAITFPSAFTTGACTNMSHMFNGCSKVTSFALTGFSTGNVTAMDYMFNNCSAATTINVSSFNTSKVTTFAYMFHNCYKATTIDVSGFTSTANATDFSFMFASDSTNMAVTSLANTSTWTAPKATTTEKMFYRCASISTLTLTAFNTPLVTNMAHMFDLMSSLSSLDITAMSTVKATSMDTMFYNTTTLRTVKLGASWSFKGAGSTALCQLPTPLSAKTYSTPYDGMWARSESSGGKYSTGYTPADLASSYARSSTWAGTWIYHVPSFTVKFYVNTSRGGVANTTSSPQTATARLDTYYTLPQLYTGWTNSNGYYFVGWNTSETATTGLAPGTSVSITADRTYYAAWSSSTYLYPVRITNASTSYTGFYDKDNDGVKDSDEGVAVGDIVLARFSTTGSGTSTWTDVYGKTWYGYKYTTQNFDSINWTSNWGRISSIVTSNYSSTKRFYLAPATSAVFNNLQRMFDYRFNSSQQTYTCGLTTIDLTRVDTSSATSATCMFYGCSSLTEVILPSTFSTANVTTMSSMFYNCSALTSLDLSGANFANTVCTDFSSMFFGCTKLATLTLGASFKVSTSVTAISMASMFRGCAALVTAPVNSTSFSCSKVTDMSYMFYGCSAMTAFAPSSTFSSSAVQNMTYMFYGCSSLTAAPVNTSYFYTPAVTNMSHMFEGCSAMTTFSVASGTNFSTSNVKTMNSMFKDCVKLATLTIGYARFTTSNVTDMAYMFYNTGFTSLSLTSSYFNTAKVTTMTYMFAGCPNMTTLNISGANFSSAALSNVTYMFASSKKLSSLTTSSAFTLNNSTLTSLAYMFYNCYAISADSVTNFASRTNTSKVTSMSMMFYMDTTSNTALAGATVNLSTLETDAVKDFTSMFYNCQATSMNVCGFKVSQLPNFSNMFYNCSKLTTIYADDDANWGEGNGSGANMFYGCSSLVGGAGSTLSIVQGTGVSTSQSYKDQYARIDMKATRGYFSTTLRTVTFNSNGGSGSHTLTSNPLNIYGETTVPGCTYTNGIKGFYAWNTASNGTGTTYYEGEYFLPSSSITLYAQWANKYTVTYNLNGIASGETMSPDEVVGIYTVPSCPYDNLGKVCAYWTSNSNGTGTKYMVGDTLTLSSNLTLYACWKDTVTVTYESNGGSGTMYPSIVGVSKNTFSQTQEFEYTGGAQVFTAPQDGQYTLETWGAQGGSSNALLNVPGRGGYAKGTVTLSQGDKLYIYVGGQGSPGSISSTVGNGGGYNGGGAATLYAGGGGGATDIRVGDDSLYSRIIVAGGGGGAPYAAGYTVTSSGSYAGNANSYSTTQLYGSYYSNSSYAGRSGLSNTYGSAATSSWSASLVPGFGYGGAPTMSSISYRPGAGGGGWYGGSAGGTNNSAVGGGGGGSNFVYTSGTPVTGYKATSYALSSTVNYSGATSFTSPTGTTETGHYGNGYARISYTLTNVSSAMVYLPNSSFTPPTGKTFSHWNTKADGTGVSYQPQTYFGAMYDQKLYAQWKNESTGNVYAIVTTGGELVFFNSDNDYANGTYSTCKDIKGHTYVGYVFSGIDALTATSYTQVPWYNYRSSIKTARVADDQTISPQSCAYWFYGCTALTKCYLSGIKKDNITSTACMFYGCTALQNIYAEQGTDWSSISGANMFYGCSSNLKGGSGTTWSSSYVTNARAKIDKLGGSTDYGYFTAKPWNVTFNINYTGSGLTTTSYTYTVDPGGSLTLIAKPTAWYRSGFLFGGWTLAGDKTARVYSPGDVYSPSENVVFNAKWNRPTGGTAYAVYDDGYISYTTNDTTGVRTWSQSPNAAKTLWFFRSNEEYTNGQVTEVVDIAGVLHYGTVYTGIEANTYTSSSVPWASKRSSITCAKVGSNMIIEPVSTAYWFYNCTALTTCLFLNNFNIQLEDLEGKTYYGEGGYLGTVDKTTNMNSMFSGATKLNTIITGTHWSYKGAGITNSSLWAVLPTPNTSEKPENGSENYTGKWAHTYYGDETSRNTITEGHNNPEGLTPVQLRDQYDTLQTYTNPSTGADVTDNWRKVGWWQWEARFKYSYNTNNGASTQTLEVMISNASYYRIRSLNLLNNESDSTTLHSIAWEYNSKVDYSYGDKVFSRRYNVKADGTGRSYSLTDYGPPTEDMTLYAMWTAPDEGSSYLLLLTTGSQTSITTTSGYAYTYTNVLTGNAVMIRSLSGYGTGSIYNGYVEDLQGNTYYRPYVLLSNIDNRTTTGTSNSLYGGDPTTSTWPAARYYVSYQKTFRIADKQIIKPKNTEYWFGGWSSMTTCDLTRLNTVNVGSSVVTGSTYGSMKGMFYGCSSLKYKTGTTSFALRNFTTGLTESQYTSITYLNTANVKNMASMFAGCSQLTSLSLYSFAWNKVTTMASMFSGCTNMSNLTLPYSTSSGTTAACTDMSYMFNGCSSLTLANISYFPRLTTSSVTTMAGMFKNTGFTSADFTVYSSTFVTTKVTSMYEMFSSNTKLTSLNVTSFKNTACTNMAMMFYGDTVLSNLSLNGFTTPAATQMYGMFCNCSALPSSTSFATFDTSKVTDMRSMFYGCSSATSLTFPTTFKGTALLYMGGDAASSYYYTRGMFQNCTSLQSVSLPGFNTPVMTTMEAAFYNCPALKSLDLSAMQSNALLTMKNAFYGDTALKSITFPETFTVPALTTMESTFENCSALEELDLSMFALPKLGILYKTFKNASALEKVEFQKLETDVITNAQEAFYGCSSLTDIDLTNFTLGRNLYFVDMFNGCSSLKELDVSTIYPNPDLAQVPQMFRMFANCTSLETIWCERTTDWSYMTTAGVHEGEDMFLNDSKLVGGTGSTIAGIRASGVTDATSINEHYAKVDTLELPGYFTMHEVTIHFDPNAPETSGTKEDIIARGTISVPSNDPITNGYWTFVGWTTTEDQDDPDCEWYLQGQTFLPAGNMTLYAQWNNEFTLTYDLNGYVGEEIPSVTKSGFVTLESFNKIFNGQICGGWNTRNDGTGDAYEFGERIFLTKDLRLYATWLSNLTVSYDGNGASGSMSDQTSSIGRKSATHTADFDYTGAVQTFTAPVDGTYKLEVWGASGGGYQNGVSTAAGLGGLGGYSHGTVTLRAGDELSIYVGGRGQTTVTANAKGLGGWNGGGFAMASSADEPANGGGGATDIRVNGTSLYNRIIVAGGGGGGGEDYGDSDNGGAGGGVQGVNATGASGSLTASSQTGTGTGGAFGFGANTNYDGGGGGGGWYGGATAGGTQSTSLSNVTSDTGGGNGGSGWVYTQSAYQAWATAQPTAAASWGLNSDYYMSADAETIAGTASMPSINGGTETGHLGDGYARITYSETADVAGMVTVPNSTFTYTDMIFASWNTKADGTGTKYLPGDQLIFTRNMTLYAQWEDGSSSRAYAILLDDGTLLFFRSYKIYAPGPDKEVVDVLGNTYTGRLYTGFEDEIGKTTSTVRWYSQMSSITSFKVADNQYIKPLNTAYWFYNANNLTEGSVIGFDMSRATSTACMFYTSTLNTPLTRIWCEEDTNWNSLSNITDATNMFYYRNKLAGENGTAYLASNYSSSSYIYKTYARADLRTPVSAATQYGYFSVKSYTVSYDPNGGTGAIDPVKVIPGRSITISDITGLAGGKGFSNGDNIFLRYNTAADGSLEDFAPGQTLTPTADVTLYAQWRYVKVGGAYAVLTPEGELIFFRSTETCTASTDATDVQEVHDADGRLYRGIVYTGDPVGDNLIDLESMELGVPEDVPWHNERELIKSVRVAENEAVNISDGIYLFDGCVNMTSFNQAGFLTDKMDSLRGMFRNCSSLTELDISEFDTSDTRLWGSMFEGCSALKELDISMLSSANLRDTASMFRGCRSLTSLDLGNLNTTKDVNLSYMFADCQSLTQLDISSITTETNYDLTGMFYNCMKLESLDLSNFNTGRTTHMGDMFAGDASLSSVKLGSNWSFGGDEIVAAAHQALLPTPPDEEKYTGSWSKDNRYGSPVKTNYELRDGYDDNKAAWAGTWVWNEYRAYTISYNSNTGTGTMEDVEVLAAHTVNAAENEFSKAGYHFVKWNTAANGSGTSYWAGEKVSANDDMTLYAQWTLPNAGTAYAVLLSEADGLGHEAGTLVFVRSNDASVETGSDKEMTDLYNRAFKGTIYTGFEAAGITAPWAADKASILSVAVASQTVIEPKTTAGWFDSCDNLTSFDGDGFDTSATTTMAAMFKDTPLLADADVSGFDVSAVKDFSEMFAGASALTSVDLSGFNTVAATDTSAMFKDAAKLTSIDLSGFKTSNVTDMSDMFNGAAGVTGLTFPSTFTTGNVTDMSGMFANASRLASLNLSTFNTAKVADFSDMFANDTSLTELNILSFNSSAATDLGGMFDGDRRLRFVDLGSAWSFKPAGATGSATPTSFTVTVREMEDDGEGGSTPGSTVSTNTYSTLADALAAANAIASANGGTSSTFTESNYKTATLSYNDGTDDLLLSMSDNGADTSTWAILPGAIWKNTTTSATYPASELRDTYASSMAARYEAQWGSAYAVLTQNDANEPNGTLVMFRSLDVYNAGTGTYTDLFGNEYKGTLFTNLEDEGTATASNSPWASAAANIKAAKVADDQTIMPVNTAYWFNGCSAMTGFDAEGLDTSHVTNMSSMFSGCRNLALLDVTGFDTSRVTDMSYMFYNNTRLSSLNVYYFDTGEVTTMAHMFDGDGSLGTLDVSRFDTENVTDMSAMFADCSRVTALDVSRFDTENVTDFSEMFYAATKLKELDLSSFDTTGADDMADMFTGCTSLTKVTLAEDWTFKGDGIEGTAKQALLPGREWINVSVPGSEIIMADDLRDQYDGSVAKWPGVYTSMGTAYAIYTNQYDTTHGAGHLIFFRSMDELTAGNNKTVSDISGNTYTGTLYTGIETSDYQFSPRAVPWRTQAVTEAHVAAGQVIQPISMANWFNGITTLTSFDGSGFETFNVTNMSNMFNGCYNLAGDIDLSSWNTHLVLSTENMFHNCASLDSVDMSGWDVSNVNSVLNMFAMDKTGSSWGAATGRHEPALASIDVTGWSLDEADSTERMFSNLVNLETLAGAKDLVKSHATSTAYMFYNCNSLAELDVSGFDTSNVSDMTSMFDGCYEVSRLAATNFDVSNVEYLDRAFADCASLSSLDLTGWDVSNVVYANEVFAITKARSGYAAGKAPSLEHLGITGWTLESVEEAEAMFENQSALIDVLGMGSLIDGAETSIASMFSGCESLTEVNFDNWDTSNVTDMTDMLADCDSIETAVLGQMFTFDGDGTLDEDSSALLPGVAWLNLDVEGSEAKASTKIQRDYDGFDPEWPGTYVRKATATLHIFFDAGEGTGSMETIDVLYDENGAAEPEPLPAPTFTKTGDWFCDGYTFDEEGEGTLYQTGDIVPMTDDNVTLYAHYTPTYKLPMTGQVPMTLMLLFAIVMLGVYVFDPEGRVMRGIRRWQVDRDVNRG